MKFEKPIFINGVKASPEDIGELYARMTKKQYTIKSINFNKKCINLIVVERAKED